MIVICIPSCRSDDYANYIKQVSTIASTDGPRRPSLAAAARSGRGSQPRMGPAALADWWEPGGRRPRRPRIADRLVPGAVAAAACGVAGLLPSVATSRDCVPG